MRSLGRVVRAWVSKAMGPSWSAGRVVCGEWNERSCKLAVSGARPESSDKRKAISASSCHKWEHD